MKNILRIFGAAFFAAIISSAGAFAAPAGETDVTGTWTWTLKGRGGKTAEETLKLEVKDGLLTGTIGGGAIPEAPISEAVLKGDAISFSVVRRYGANSFTTKYTGKVKGDTISGSYRGVRARGGETRSVNWEAQRVKP